MVMLKVSDEPLLAHEPDFSALSRFFIFRGEGVFVPLFPADELPATVHLAGVPRSLKKDENTGHAVH